MIFIFIRENYTEVSENFRQWKTKKEKNALNNNSGNMQINFTPKKEYDWEKSNNCQISDFDF